MMLYKHVQGAFTPNNSEEPPRWQLHYDQQRARLTGQRL